MLKDERNYRDAIQEKIDYLFIIKDYYAGLFYNGQLEDILNEMKSEQPILTFDPIYARIKQLYSDIDNYCKDKKSESNYNFFKKWIEESVENSLIKVPWDEFVKILNKIKYLKDPNDIDKLKKYLAKAVIEVLKKQGTSKENRIDLMSPLFKMEKDFMYTYFVREIKNILTEYGDNKLTDVNKKTKLKQLIGSLHEEDEQSILENIGNRWIWEIITGIERIDIVYYYEPRVKKNINSDVENDTDGNASRQDVLNEFEKDSVLKRVPFIYPISTLISPNGFKLEYTTWNFGDVGYRNFLRAETIIFHNDIPKDKLVAFNASRVSKFDYLKILKFEDGVSTVPKVFDASVCPNIEEIYISETVTEIQEDAFYGLNSIKKIIIDMVSPKANSLIIERSSVREIEINTLEGSQKLVLKNCNNIEKMTIGGKSIPFYSIAEGSDSYIYLSEERLQEERSKQVIIVYKEHKDGEIKEKAYSRFFDKERGIFKGIRFYSNYTTKEEAQESINKLEQEGKKAIIGPPISFPCSHECAIYILDNSVEDCIGEYKRRYNDFYVYKNKVRI